jgi:hypothetical protein
MEEKTTGPDVMLHIVFPRKEIFKIREEFKLQGKVFTISYVVKVS